MDENQMIIAICLYLVVGILFFIRGVLLRMKAIQVSYERDMKDWILSEGVPNKAGLTFPYENRYMKLTGMYSYSNYRHDGFVFPQPNPIKFWDDHEANDLEPPVSFIFASSSFWPVYLVSEVNSICVKFINSIIQSRYSRIDSKLIEQHKAAMLLSPNKHIRDLAQDSKNSIIYKETDNVIRPRKQKR